MTRSELIEKIAAKMPNLTVKDIDNVVNVIFSRLTKALAEGDRVELRGFGAFSIRKRNPRVAINPKTKEEIEWSEDALKNKYSTRQIDYIKKCCSLHKMGYGLIWKQKEFPELI